MFLIKIPKCLHRYGSYRLYCTTKIQKADLRKIRNIGILAHIDAGKTTTTERMLYYAGLINQMGEVHHGNTVTDYMDQERERGITITSAAVTFFWKDHQFNLIDTPGHIDFTMEVEQTLKVLDGAVVVLDGSAGVEAQTLTVWRQADRYNIPRIIFINKMDRCDSSLQFSCRSIEEKLEKTALPLQLPVIENRTLVGLVDLISMQKITFDKGKTKQINYCDLIEANDLDLWTEAKLARSKLVDRLCEFNDNIADLVITTESLDSIKSADIIKALRQVTIEQVQQTMQLYNCMNNSFYFKLAVPVLLGSSYKNVGVQPLMDAIFSYLPSPCERNQNFMVFDENLCARAFKVKHDKQKGPLVFFRIYNGAFHKNQKLYSIQQDKSEQIGRLYQTFADEFREVEQITNGNIAVVSGLKYTMSGDLVANSQSATHTAKAKMAKLKMNNADIEHLLGRHSQVPEPVFLCAIEPPSLAYQAALEQALNELQREDPSLRVTNDSETGQTVLAGMGELHLEIIKDRILKEYKVDAELGPLQIAYHEAPLNKTADTFIVDTTIGNNKQYINIKLSVIPTKNQSGGGDVMRLDKSQDAASNISAIFHKHLLAIRQGIDVGLAHGPKVGCQVVNVDVMLHWFEAGRGTSETMIAAAATQLVQKLIKDAGCIILEPIMYLEIVSPDDYISAIMADLSRRRTTIDNIAMRGNMKVITCDVPLAELLGYSTILRTISSGTATFTMEFNEYKAMSFADESIAIKNVRGF